MQTREFQELISGHEMIALIANSEDVDIDHIVASLPDKTLFVFFTGCSKVLARPFTKDAILCHRLVAGGTRFLKSQNTFNAAYSLFPNGLKTEIGVLADPGKADDAPRLHEARTSQLVPFVLDFDHQFGSLYPLAKSPTTGFALAFWLLDRMPDLRVSLCGFTGVPGLQFGMYSDHDWTFEQIVLSLLEKSGRLIRFDGKGSISTHSFDRIKRHFPAVSDAMIAMTASQVLSNRFGGLEGQVARLWSMTKWQRRIKSFFARLKKKRSLRKHSK